MLGQRQVPGLRPCRCPGADVVALRLVGGGSPCAGRVEAKLRGRWGAVASDTWNTEEAEVVCQQLGCGSAAGAYTGSRSFGVGDGPINLAVVHCRGHEATIWDCEIAGWGPYSALHDYDTAVICQGGSWVAVGHTPVLAHRSPLSPAPSRQGLPGWWVVTAAARGGWKCGGTERGPASARTAWTSRPPRWFAGSWAAAWHWPSPAAAGWRRDRGRSGRGGSSATAPSPS